jgi:hypothetical protein
MIPLIKKTKKGNAGEKKNKVLTSCASRRYVAVGFLKENIIAPDLIIATATFNKHTCASITKSTPLLQYSKFPIHRHNPELPWSRLKTTSYISFLQTKHTTENHHPQNLSRTNQLPLRKKDLQHLKSKHQNEFFLPKTKSFKLKNGINKEQHNMICMGKSDKSNSTLIPTNNTKETKT